MSGKQARDFVTTREAAEILGCSMTRVRQLRMTGKIPTEWIGHIPVHPRAAIDALKKERDVLRMNGSMRGPRPSGFSSDKAGKRPPGGYPNEKLARAARVKAARDRDT